MTLTILWMDKPSSRPRSVQTHPLQWTDNRTYYIALCSECHIGWPFISYPIWIIPFLVPVSLGIFPIHHTLSLVQQVPAFEPHQYLAKNEQGDQVYTTSWALPPALSSWSIKRADDRLGRSRISTRC